jgi:hypothetical protein
MSGKKTLNMLFEEDTEQSDDAGVLLAIDNLKKLAISKKFHVEGNIYSIAMEREIDLNYGILQLSPLYWSSFFKKYVGYLTLVKDKMYRDLVRDDYYHDDHKIFYFDSTDTAFVQVFTRWYDKRVVLCVRAVVIVESKLGKVLKSNILRLHKFISVFDKVHEMILMRLEKDRGIK